jgi:hypothetical protein
MLLKNKMLSTTQIAECFNRKQAQEVEVKQNICDRITESLRTILK